MNTATKTDAGKVRTNNEDSMLVDAERGIFLLADGMGGHNAGEVASDLAVKEAYTYILSEIERAEDGMDYFGILKEALFRAHKAIQEKAKTDIRFNGMGTTLVELLVRDDKAYICHAGDSRAYLFRKTLRRLTKDHTVGDSWVEKGYMTREQVPPQQWHTLTQAAGIGNYPAPDKKTFKLKPGDTLLLCSDGLTDMLEDAEIEALFKQHDAELQNIVDALIEEANNKGGRDNISVVIVNYD